MQTKEKLSKLYSKLPDKKLLDIVNDKDQYTDIALNIALEEIRKREIKTDQVQDYIENKILETKISEHVASIELTFLEKVKFFCIWFLPFIEVAFRMNLIEDGLKTKVKQSRVFSTVGFLTFMLTGFLGVIFEHSNFESFSIWFLFFVLTYFIEKRFRKTKSST
ncbi:MAG TPA: hypothetical protein PLJ60_05330 [Chryseolinea sp.]|nr:hypothetical protein [Chryseolinea sp.]HPM29741.1 hypothetical protein [Chryseolinea sp.]